MLDNLKLGYGGTKEEMQRLLSDAQKLTGTKYDIDNLADVYNAIHAIQENLGVTGTTAKEASETFSGSFSDFASSPEMNGMMLPTISGQSLNVLPAPEMAWYVLTMTSCGSNSFHAAKAGV